jgi:hypothetical protein
MTERRKSERRKSARTHPEWWNRLHMLWTWAVGKEGYDKRKWADLEASIKKEIDGS